MLRLNVFIVFCFIFSSTLRSQVTVNAVVVGGGGGAGAATAYTAGGGGGAGGAVQTATITLSGSTVYSVTVGAGGAFQGNGSSSILSGTGITTITAAGGSKGSNAVSTTGGNGGTNGTAYGAGGKGMNQYVNTPNHGADGVNIPVLSSYFGGGGGGGNYGGSPSGYGKYGLGAGGNGTVNDGGGARGQNANLNNTTAGLGVYGTADPGVVIIYYAGSTPLITGGSVSSVVYNSTTYQVHRYTSSGSFSLISFSNTASTASSSPAVCLNAAIPAITHTTTGATGIGTPTGLPAGVTASWSANTITISGTPTTSGIFNYSIPLTGGTGDVSATGTIRVSEPVFTLHPSSAAQTVCSGASPLTAEAYLVTGTIASYKWYTNASASNTGGTLVATNITSSSSNSYNPTATAYYYAVVTDALGCTGTSNVSGLVTVLSLPTISSQPSTTAQSVCLNGSPTALSITAAAGSGDIRSYRWYSNTTASTSGGTLLSTTNSSATTSSYTPTATVAGTRYYYAVVTNTNGCVNTSAVSGAVTVSPLSVAGTASASTSVIPTNGSTTLSLTGYTGSIQWQQSADGSTGWTNVSGGSGATSASYTTYSISSATYFRAVITSGGCNSVYSNVIYIETTTAGVGDVLVVSGGGSGGANFGGGGGGGAVKYFTNQTLSGSVNVIVGAGGASTATNTGNAGESSFFGSLTATSSSSASSPPEGGGGGGSGGGKNGGFMTSPVAGGVAVSGMGYNGGSGNGNGVHFSAAASGGGGGAGGVGGNGSVDVRTGYGGAGGIGVLNSITGTAVYYGGGGGGGVNSNGGTPGAGGQGGGAAGTKGLVTPDPATPNTGGGGGGNGQGGVNGVGQPTAYGGAGGSGVVIVRYPGTVATATGGEISYPSGYVVHRFTSSGTFVWTGGSPTISITSSGSATACYSASAQTTSLTYSASTGDGTSYSIDWNAAANTAGLTDQSSTSHTFASGGGTISNIAIPAAVPAGSYTGTMTISNGTSTITQSVTLLIGAVGGDITGSTIVNAGTNSTVLTLSGHSGSIQWQSSSNNSTFSNISGATSTTYTATNLSATTFYRAALTNAACTVAYSNTATITVSAFSTNVSITGTTTANTISNNVATVVDPNIVVTANGTITGFTVTITNDYTEGDLLEYTGTLPSGVTAAEFNTTSRSLNFSGTASAAQWQELLRTVTLISTSNCYPTNRKVSFLPSVKYYNYFNGHFYEYVSTPLSWSAAKTAAASRSFYGRKGYLVTISSAEENNFVWKLIAQNSWIGLSCVYTEINSALGYNKFETTTFGQFYWVTGPEKGTAVSTGLGGSRVSATGVYNNWSTGEPNNYLSWGENSGHLYANSGKWNDFKQEGANNGTVPIPYIVEYGGLDGDDTSSAIAFTRDIIISGSPAGTVSGASTVCAGTNSTVLTYSGTGTIQNWEYSTDNFVTAGTSVASTSTTLTVSNISESRYYRAVVDNTGCLDIPSAAVLITAVSTKAGTITAESGNICEGGSTALVLSGNNGSIQNWQVSTTSDFSAGNTTTINNTTNNLSYSLATTGDYYFRASILNSTCTGGTAVYTDAYPIVVTGGTIPVGGTVNSVSYCGGSNSGTLTLSGSTGLSYQWQESTDGGVVWTDAASTTTTLSYSSVSATTNYRVLVTGSCGSAYSAEGQVAVGGTSGAIWTGTVSTDWGNAANWCGYVIGENGLDVQISSSATYAPTLDQHRTIGNLLFNNAGKILTLGAFNLTAISVSGADSDDYVKTNSSGKLIMSISNGYSADFQLGNTAYNPVTITNNTGIRDDFSVRVLDEVYANAVSGTLVSNNRVKRSWEISKATANAGDGVDLVFGWNAGETSSLSVPALFVYTGGSWSMQTGATSYSSTSLSFEGYTGSFTTFALMQPDFGWTGAGGNNLWDNAGNWSGGVVPITASNILISSGTPRLNVDFTFTGSLTLSGSATLTVDAGKTLSIGSGGVVDFGGKEVVFKSDATGTAQLGVVTGTLTGATNVVVERHIPSGKRAFRFFSSAVTTTGSIRDNWMEGATPGVVSGYPYTTTSAYNPNSGYGTHITGSGGTTNGFDESGTNNPSLFTFNNSTGAWAEVTSTASTIGLGNAYRLLIRGNRAYNINGSPTQTATATILRTRGTLSTGTLTSGVQLPALSQVINGWSLVGNPYQSVVDMAGSDVVKTNLTDYYYIWDPRMGTQGAYVAYNYVMNTSANVSSAVNRYVQPGQAFFVQASAAGSAIQFREAGKGASSNQTATFGKNDGRGGASGNEGYKIEVTQQRNEVTQTGGFASLSMLLYETDSLAKGGSPADAARVLFGAGYNNNVDVKDGRKFTNLDETMSVKQSNTLLSMELRSLPDTGTLLPLNIAQYRGTKYTLRVFWDRMLTDSTKRAYVRDKFTGKELAIDRNGAYMDHGYTITSDAKSSAADRFEVVFRTASNVVTAVTNWSNGDYVKLYPNPVINLLQVEYRVGIQRELTLKVYDMSGREVMERKQLKSGDQVNMSGLPRGIYQYQLLDKTGKLISSGKIMTS